MPTRQSRRQCVAELADGIAAQLAPSRRASGVREAMVKAATDLAALYEDLNGERIDDIFAFLEHNHGTYAALSGSTNDIGGWLAQWAIDQDISAKVAGDWGIRVPAFRVWWEDADTLAWEGEGERDDGWRLTRNPGREFEVLLIEDEERLQKATARMIKKLYPTATVLVSDNAEAAIANLKHHDIKLVISDFDLLGEGTGGDVFAWVQANRPHLVDRFVFFTGNSAAEALHYRYLPKGAVTADDLRAEIWKDAPRGAPAAEPELAGKRTVRDLRPARYTRKMGLSDFTAPTTAVRAEPWTDKELADEILAATRALPDPPARYGEHKVFLWPIWKAIRDRSPTPLSLEAFKARAVDLHRRGLVVLARADYVSAMDPEMVAQSEYHDPVGNADWHFVLAPDHRWSAGSQTRAAAHHAREEAAEVPIPILPTRTVESAGPDNATFDRMIEGGLVYHPPGSPGRWGDHKVYIYALWQSLSHDPKLQRMSLETFKKRLLDANRRGTVDLSGADLPSAMDREMLRQSVIMHMGTRYYTVVDPRAHYASSRASYPRDVEDARPTPVQPGDVQLDHETLDGLIAEAIQKTPHGSPARLGPANVFIYAIWERLNGDPRFKHMSLEQFKRRLVEANRQSRVLLSRADMIDHTNPVILRYRDLSEISDLGATFHYVTDPNVDANDYYRRNPPTTEYLATLPNGRTVWVPYRPDMLDASDADDRPVDAAIRVAGLPLGSKATYEAGKIVKR